MATGTIQIPYVSQTYTTVDTTHYEVNSINNNTVVKWGRVVSLTLSINYKVTQTFSSGTWVEIATLPSGLAPPQDIVGGCFLHTGNGTVANAGCQLLLGTDGTININPLVSHSATTTLKLLRINLTWIA